MPNRCCSCITVDFLHSKCCSRTYEMFCDVSEDCSGNRRQRVAICNHQSPNKNNRRVHAIHFTCFWLEAYKPAAVSTVKTKICQQFIYLTLVYMLLVGKCVFSVASNIVMTHLPSRSMQIEESNCLQWT